MSAADTTTDRTTGSYVYAMPSLGADMEEGMVIEWLVGPGDRVSRGDVVARVETDKSDIDIEIWVDGVVSAVQIGLNEIVAVGTPLLLVDPDSTDDLATAEATGTIAPAESEAVEPALAPSTAPESPTIALSPHGTRVAASPLARRRADELGIDLAAVEGTGPAGAVRVADVDEVASDSAPATSTSPPPSPATRVERMRQKIASRMSTSNREVPHYRLERLVDVSRLLERLDEHNREASVSARIVPTAAFVVAVSRALAKHPPLNGTWLDDRFVPASSVDVAVAISTRSGGLLAPTIVGADELDLVSTMERLRQLTTAVRSGSVRDQWFGGTPATTVTSLADRGPDVVHGLITVPQTSLVGFGRIAHRPVVVDGEVIARPTVIVSLDADHRATDGAAGGRFIETLASSLESASI